MVFHGQTMSDKDSNLLVGSLQARHDQITQRLRRVCKLFATLAKVKAKACFKSHYAAYAYSAATEAQFVYLHTGLTDAEATKQEKVSDTFSEMQQQNVAGNSI